jgi:hypothetical protein
MNKTVNSFGRKIGQMNAAALGITEELDSWPIISIQIEIVI